METDIRAALRIDAAGQIPREEHRGHPRDVRLVGQRQQIPLHADVLIERFRYPVGHGHGRGIQRRLGGDREAPLNLAHIVGVLLKPHLIAMRHLCHQIAQAAVYRVENARWRSRRT